MATGYTYPIYEGQEMTFEQFMLRCARNFGALIHMQEDPLDAPIPDEILPEDDFYLEEIKETEKELANFLANRPTLEELEERYAKYAEEKRNEILKENERRQVVKERYIAMLDKVKAWNPPTKDHENLKKFAIDQLEVSIEFDCKDYSSPIKEKDEWIEFEMNLDKYLQKVLDCQKIEHEKEVQSAKSKTEWIQVLKKSLI